MRPEGCLLVVISLVAIFPSALPLAAQERILSYDSEIEILPDGVMEVAEHITVRAEGNEIRRGIYRDFPTRYRDRYGNRVRVGFDVLGVERNGASEPWFTERLSNGVRVNTGTDELLPVPAEHTFTIRYRTTRQLGYFADHDELYWNAIGAGWVFPVETGTVEVRLPEPVPVESMTVEAYTGPEGTRGTAYEAVTPAPGVARYRLTAELAPGEAFTIVLTFPKGVVPEPTRAVRARWLLADNRGVLVAILGLIVLALFCFRRWLNVGRDPPPGLIIPRYEPGTGFTPAGVRYLRRMGYDARCFSSDILALAVGGHLRIARDKRLFKDQWTLHREAAGTEGAGGGSQGELLAKLFTGGRPTLSLESSNATTLAAARQAHQKALDRQFHPRYFKRNAKDIVVAAAIAVLASALAFVTSGGFAVPAIMAVVAIMAVGVILFAYLIRAPTPEGRTLLDEIEGLELYLTVAERDELARVGGPHEAPPPVDAGRYEALLPFAVALGVEEAWTRKFTAAVGRAAAEAATTGMHWYSGRGAGNGLSGFTHALGSTLSAQISSASSPPGSGSGSGGGGSSGGGGGGGGGGGR